MWVPFEETKKKVGAAQNLVKKIVFYKREMKKKALSRKEKIGLFDHCHR